MTHGCETSCLSRKGSLSRSHEPSVTLLFQIHAHKGLRSILLPVGKPREDEQARTLDVAILSAPPEGLPIHANTAHHPLPAGAQVRLHVSCLKAPFGAPPFHTLIGMGQRVK